MTKQLNCTYKALIALGLLGLGLFIFFDPLADADQQMDAGVLGLETGGQLEVKSDGVIGSFVDPYNNLFLVWKEKDTQNIFFNYFNGSVWSQPVQVMDYSGNPILTNYGVEAVIAVDSLTAPIVCLFYKPTWDTKQQGLIDYTCSPLVYDTKLIPQFTFEPTREFMRIKGDVVGMLSSTPVPTDRTNFTLAWAEYNSATVGSIRTFTCKLIQGLRIDCGDYILVDNNIRGDRTGIADVKGIPFLFYSDTYNANDKINYFPNSLATGTVLENSSGNPRQTRERIAAHAFSDNIFVAFTDLELTSGEGSAVQFARISADDLSSVDDKGRFGFKKWQYCKLQADGVSLAYSAQGPTLVEYADGLYLFFTYTLFDDQITYIRIDTLAMNGEIC